MGDIEWNTPKGDTVIIPVMRPNREDLRGIPLGAPTLVTNNKEEGTEYVAIEWNAEVRDSWIEQLDDEEERFGVTALFYVNPTFLKGAEPKREAVLPDHMVVQKVLHDIGDADEDFPLALVREARKGLVENPF